MTLPVLKPTGIGASLTGELTANGLSSRVQTLRLLGDANISSVRVDATPLVLGTHH
jgi:hypothetical protein